MIELLIEHGVDVTETETHQEPKLFTTELRHENIFVSACCDDKEFSRKIACEMFLIKLIRANI